MTEQPLSHAEINSRIRPFMAREIARFLFRVGLMRRRGQTPEQAEYLADRLALRDQEKDDRRLCLECAHLQQPVYRNGPRGCFAVQQGLMQGAPVLDLFQRCPQFEWSKP